MNVLSFFGTCEVKMSKSSFFVVTLLAVLFSVDASLFYNDPVLKNAIEKATPKLAAAIAKYVHMSGVERAAPETDDPIYIPFPDAYYTPDMIFRDVAVIGKAPLKMMRMDPNIKASNIWVLARWEYLFLTMTYNDLRLVIKIQDLIGEGIEGMGIEDDHYIVTNTDFGIFYTFLEMKKLEGNKVVPVYDLENRERFLLTLENYFRKHIELFFLVEIKETVNEMLKEIPVESIFEGNQQVVATYKLAVQKRDESINQLVDFLLMLLRGFLQLNHYDKIKGPDINEPFETKIFGVPVKGQILIEHGEIWNLSSVVRTSSFSLDGDLEADEFTLFGSLGFKELAAFYSHYKVDIATFHPEGNLQASVKENSVFFKVKGNLKDPEVLKIHDFKVEVQKLDGISVKSSGAGSGLDWLISKIVEWAADHFKTQLSTTIDKEVDKLLRQQLNSMDWKIPLNP